MSYCTSSGSWWNYETRVYATMHYDATHHAKCNIVHITVVSIKYNWLWLPISSFSFRHGFIFLNQLILATCLVMRNLPPTRTWFHRAARLQQSSTRCKRRRDPHWITEKDVRKRRTAPCVVNVQCTSGILIAALFYPLASSVGLALYLFCCF